MQQQQTGATGTQPMKTLSLVKGNQQFCFRYQVGEESKVLESLIEMVNRRFTGNNWHSYVKPERKIEEGAKAVHGISDEFLADKRAFAELANFVSACGHLVARGGALAAMKGTYPGEELGRLPACCRCDQAFRLRVPLLDAERHLVLCRVESQA